MEASKRQLGYLIKLARESGVHMEMDDFYGEHGDILLSSKEASDLIQNYQFAQKKPEDPADVQRKKIISMARSIGWTKASQRDESKQVADMQRIYGWVLKYGYLHKGMNEYTAKELPKLVTQFQTGPFKHKLANKQ